MNRRLFVISSALSFAMCLATATVWHRAVRSYVSERDRIERLGNEIHRAVEEAPWGTPAYRQHMAEYDAWRNARDNYRQREPEVLANQHRRYTTMPLAIVIALAILPLAWLYGNWRAWKQRWAIRSTQAPTLVLRILRRLLATSAVFFFLLAIATAAVWVRSYSVTDSIYLSRFFDEGELTFWRQTLLQLGRGSLGLNPNVQSGPVGTYRRDINALYVRNFARELSSIPVHSVRPARDLNFRFGPDQRKWGFAWGYFEHGQAGKRPRNYGYELVVPLWSVEILFLIVPAIWAWRWFKHRHLVQRGHCQTCGYNLTGNTSALCSECGTAIPRTAETPETNTFRPR